MDRRRHIRFTDIAAKFLTEQHGKTMDDLMAEIHGRMPDGRWIVGVEVFRQLYRALGLGVFVGIWGSLASRTALTSLTGSLPNAA